MNHTSMGYTDPKKCEKCGGTHIHYWTSEDKEEKCIMCVRTKTLKMRGESAKLNLTLRGALK